LEKKNKEEEEKKIKDTKEEMLVLYGAKWHSSINSVTVLFYSAYSPMPL
jgi:hypothetical protein